MSAVQKTHDEFGPRLILFSEDLSSSEVSELPETLRSLLEDGKYQLATHSLKMTYESYTALEIIKYYFPDFPMYREIYCLDGIACIFIDSVGGSQLIGQIVIDKLQVKSGVGMNKVEGQSSQATQV